MDQYPTSEDGSLKGTAFEQYFNEVIGAFNKNGYVGSPGPHLEQWFREAGFVDIHVQKYRVPMGTWPKDPYYVRIFPPPSLILFSLSSHTHEANTHINIYLQKKIGTWMMLQGEQGYEAGAMAVLTRNESWSREKVLELVDKTKSDARNRNIHALFNLCASLLTFYLPTSYV